MLLSDFIFLILGTGKTYTGIKLVYLFDIINDMLRSDGCEHQQVVFCGPNNKSVDLVASKCFILQLLISLPEPMAQVSFSD